MSFSRVVQVKSVFPSPLGGAVFKGIPVGEFCTKSFRASCKTLSRIPVQGEFWKIDGQIVETNEYGNVVIVTSAFLHELPSFNYVGRLLNNHPAFRGFHFGKSKVRKLIDVAGAYALVDILNKADVIALIDTGLSKPIAQKVCEVWGELKEETEVATFLNEHNLDSSLAAKILCLCRYDTVARLKRNPFALIAVSNASRKNLQTIRRVAEKLGIGADDRRCLIGAVEFAIYQELDQGNTIVKIDKAKRLVKTVLETLQSSVPAAVAIKVALEAKVVCVLEYKNETCLQSLAVAYIEQYVESRLLQLYRSPLTANLLISNPQTLKKRLGQYNSDQILTGGFALNKEQNQAVLMSLQCRISLLSGFGGTGKTTVLKAIVKLARQQLIPVFVCALAGKAANRASQAVEEDASTIHALIQKVKNDKTVQYELDFDPLIIIDEASMIDMSLICNLLRALADKNFRLLLVGDTAQLPPIGFGLLYHKLVNSNAPQTRLTQVHRQVHGSPLHVAAMAIRRKKKHDLPRYEGQSQGIYLLDSGDNAKESVVRLRSDINCMVLTPFSSGRYYTSTDSLNPVIQDIVNEQEDSKLKLTMGSTTIQIGDPVIATKNVLNLGLFNGMTGVVTAIEVQESQVVCTILFEGSEVQTTLNKDQCWELSLQLAYAITIHKSQGSEYENCAIILGSPMIENSALYTAITRTKRLCILIGSQKMYDDAIMRQPRYETVACGFSPVFKSENFRDKQS
jgi:exodeoxyribonuclease V alpha subunit